jgi:hypothetical protein
MDQRTSAEYKAFQDELRGKTVRKTDTEESMTEKTLRDEIEALKTRLARVEEVLRSLLAA